MGGSNQAPYILVQGLMEPFCLPLSAPLNYFVKFPLFGEWCSRC